MPFFENCGFVFINLASVGRGGVSLKRQKQECQPDGCEETPWVNLEPTPGLFRAQILLQERVYVLAVVVHLCYRIRVCRSL